MAKLKVFEKNEDRIKGAALMGISMVICYIASKGNILGFSSPLNVAVVAVCGGNSIPAFIAAVLSYFINGNFLDGVPQICSMAVLVILKTLVFPDRHNDTPFSLAVMTGAVMLFFGSLFSLIVPTEIELIIYRVFSSLICFFAVFFFEYSLDHYKEHNVLDIKGFNGVSLSVLYVMAVAVLTSVSIAGINLGRAFGVVIMLFAINKYRHIGGAVCGALATCGVILCSPDLAKNTLLLATSGLICGAFAPLGIAAIIIVFIAVSLISLATIGMNSDTFMLFADLIAGTVIYLAIPDGRFSGNIKVVNAGSKSAKISGDTASSKISFASGAIFDVKNQISTVTDAMEKKATPTQLGKLVKENVCSSCSMNYICWKKKEPETTSVFTQLQRKIACLEKLTGEDIERKLPDCQNKLLVANTFNLMYTNMLFEQSSSRKLREMRDFLSTQLETMGDMLDDISDGVSRISNIDPGLSARAEALLERQGCINSKACVYIDERKMLRAEAFYDKKSSPDLVRLTVDLSDIIGCDLEMPKKVTVGELTKLEFTEKPVYRLDYGVFQRPSVAGQHSGDYYEKLSINSTESYVILSDGMGTGNRARLDAMFTVNLATRLLTAGVSDSTTVRLLNSVLQVKCWEESFATLDLVKFDLCGGYMSVLKAGACASYLYRDGALKKIEGYAFPLGILSETNPRQLRYKLFRGDVIVVCSDGVDEASVKKVFSDRKIISKLDPDVIAGSIGELICNSQDKPKHDDVTLIVSKIEKV